MAFEDLMEKAAGHHMNPAMGRAHEKMRSQLDGKVAKPEHGEHGEHGRVEETSVVKHKDGKAHVRARHEDGHEVVHRTHDNEDAAQEHARSIMAGGGEEDHAMPEHAMGEMGQEPEEAEEGQECPECGSKMEDGTCPQCGYKEESGEEHGREVA